MLLLGGGRNWHVYNSGDLKANVLVLSELANCSSHGLVKVKCPEAQISGMKV